MDHLHEADAGQCFAQLPKFGMRHVIDKLQRGRAALAMLLDDAVGVLPGSEQERDDRRRNGRSDLRDQFVGDHARAARHRRHQAER
jgi:hypothetical protein